MTPGNEAAVALDRSPRPPCPDSSWAFLQGGGELGALVRQKDWSQSRLGSIEGWPQSLRSAVSICLGSGFPIALYWGPELVLLYNDAWSPIPGAKHPLALGEPAREVWPEIWDTIGPLFQHVLTTGEATRSQDQLLSMRRHGYTEECYFDYTFSPIRGESGKVEGIFNAVIETTDRVIGERRLRLVRELAERAAEARTAEQACQIAAHSLGTDPADIPFALLYLISDDGNEARLAGAAGLDTANLASPACIPLSGPQSDAPAWPVAKVVRSGAAELVENIAQRLAPLPGGPWPESPGSALVLPMARAGTERLYGVLVAGVSPRRPLDSDYRLFLNIVASHIAQALANAEAHEEERARAEALAEIDRAKTTFLSNVSHEFRTPLTLMLGPLEEILARQKELPPAVTDLVAATHRNGLRLQKLVNTLLDFSRIEAGRAQASYEPVDLASRTSELASTFASAVEKAGLQLIVECPPLPEPVYVDPEMWEKVVLNLISNAFKYTFSGKIIVRLGQQQELAVLSVEDTGIGIAEGELPKLFERFHRVEGARGRTLDGTGIGLALVAELIRLHAGTVGVRSVLGQGSTFTVSLPFGTAHLPQERIGAARKLASTALHAESFVDEAMRWLPRQPDLLPPASNTPRLRIPDARVLVADDNADMRDYVSRLLSERYEVETAANGEEALQRVLANPPDLVLSDIMMPGLDGFALLHALRTKPQTSTVPVILLSARAGEESRVEGLDAGASDYLIKPFTARELLARVGAHLEMARVRKQAAAREVGLRREAEGARDEAVGVLESITDAFAAFDREWRFIYVNPKAEQLARLRQDQLLGNEYWEIFPATLGTVVEREFRRAARDRVPVDFEYFHQPWNVWFALKGYPTRDGGLSVYFRDITEQKLGVERLRESQQRLSAIYDGTYEYIGLLAPDGTLLEANRASLEFAGNTRDDVVGRPFWDTPWFTATPGAPELVRQSVARAAAGEFVRFEATVYRPSGESQTFDISFHPIRNECGQVVLIVPEGRNITERKQAEEELRQSQQRFQAAVRAVTDLVWTNNARGEMTGDQPGWGAFTGQAYDEYQGYGWAEAVHPDDARPTIDAWTQAVAQRKQFVFEHRVRRHDGVWRLFSIRAVPVLDEDGVLREWVGVHTDITDRRRHEEALRQSEERFRQVAESMPQVVWSATSERVPHYVNCRWTELTGCDLAATQAGEFRKYMLPEDLATMDGVVAQGMQAGKPYGFECRFTRASDGTRRWHLVRAVPVRSPAGEVVKWLGTSTDIDEQKRAAEALELSQWRLRFTLDSANLV